VEANRPTDPRERFLADEIDWQDALAQREAQARELIRAHPVAAVLGAAAIGFAIARLMRGDE
jgi:hypothetical protein